MADYGEDTREKEVKARMQNIHLQQDRTPPRQR